MPSGGGEALNGYHYVSGNLLQARDPLGLDVKETTDNSHVPEEVAWGDDGAWYASAENFTESEEQREQLRQACGSTYTQGCHDALEALSELEGITIVVFVQGGLEAVLGAQRLSRTQQAAQFVTEQAGSEAAAGGNPDSVGGTNPNADVTVAGQVAVVAASIVSIVSDVIDVATGVVGAIKHLAEIGFERAIRALLDPNNIEEAIRRIGDGPTAAGGSTASVLPPHIPSSRRNGRLAGDTHRSGVPFDADGYPDFSAHLHPDTPEVRIELSGSRTTDRNRANAEAGYDETPRGYVWHHHQESGRMQLVEAGVHRRTGHDGGYAGN